MNTPLPAAAPTSRIGLSLVAKFASYPAAGSSKRSAESFFTTRSFAIVAFGCPPHTFAKQLVSELLSEPIPTSPPQSIDPSSTTSSHPLPYMWISFEFPVLIVASLSTTSLFKAEAVRPTLDCPTVVMPAGQFMIAPVLTNTVLLEAAMV